jgi:hypothetical protein
MDSHRAGAPLSTPVALFVFNRPEHTARVLAAVARARPRTLLVVADGPRPDRAGEAERCAAVRELVAGIDWECTVLRDYADENLGCRRRVSSGLDWVFSECERAIVLEDDCVPDPSFFRFADELLERYADDERVMTISGTSVQRRPPADGSSYYFSGYSLIWGWATWRRAWRLYDREMRRWPELRAGFVDLGDEESERYWRAVFDRTHAGEIDTWDYQWLFTSRVYGGLSAIPAHNLVSNIGFGADATHTLGDSEIANLPATALRFPLRHPKAVARDLRADRMTFRRLFQPMPSLRSRIAAAVRGRTRAFLRRLPGAGAASVDRAS